MDLLNCIIQTILFYGTFSLDGLTSGFFRWKLKNSHHTSVKTSASEEDTLFSYWFTIDHSTFIKHLHLDFIFWNRISHLCDKMSFLQRDNRVTIPSHCIGGEGLGECVRWVRGVWVLTFISSYSSTSWGYQTPLLRGKRVSVCVVIKKMFYLYFSKP